MLEVNKKKTGELIKQKCEALNLTPKDLTERLQVTVTAPYYWVEGKSMPRLDTLVSLCRLLGCTVEEILILEGEMETANPIAEIEGALEEANADSEV